MKNIYVANAECLPLARTRHFTAEETARSFAVYEPVVVILSVILQGFTTATRLLSLSCCINTPTLQTGAANDVFALNRRSVFLVTGVTFVRSTGHFIPPLFVFPSKNMKQELLTDTQLDQSTLAIPRDGYRARFSPCGVFVLSNIKSRQ